MPERDQLDLLIDAAIAAYAEPPAALEDRILGGWAASRFPSSAKPNGFPHRRLIPWLVALSAAACLLVALLLRHHAASHPLRALSPATPPMQSSPPKPVPAILPEVRAPHSALRRRSHKISAAAPPDIVPRLDVFPTPEKMTAQEQALVSFVSRAPKPRLDALINAQQQSNRPLTIPAIQIEPIEPPDPGNR